VAASGVVGAGIPCASPVGYATIQLLFNTSQANSSLAFPLGGQTLYLTGGTGDYGVLAPSFSGLKLLIDSTGSAGTCGQWRPLGTFTSN
jgi:hypothetical protein